MFSTLNTTTTTTTAIIVMTSIGNLDVTLKKVTFEAHVPKVLLFGDSITQRCYSMQEGKYENSDEVFILGSALSDLFKRRMDVVHRGFSGYTTEQARFMIDTLIETLPNIKLAVSFFFLNQLLLI